MLYSLFFLLALVASHVTSDQTNPLSDTGQAEELINNFLRCIVQSRAFPQQELSNRINAMKKTLISTWNSRRTPREKSQLTTLAFASALADLTKPGNNPTSVASKKRNVQQCLQKATLEIEGVVNYAFVQEMMQAINLLQEKSKSTNTQPVGTSAISREPPKSFDLPNSFQSLTSPPLKTSDQLPTGILSSGSFSKSSEYSDDFLPSHGSKIPTNFQFENSNKSPSFSMDTGFIKNTPQLPLEVPGLENLQDQSQTGLFSNPYGSPDNFKTTFSSTPKINDNNNKEFGKFGGSFSRNSDFSTNFDSTPGLQVSSFRPFSESSSRNMGFLNNLSPFSGATGMNKMSSLQMPEEVFPKNLEYPNNFGSTSTSDFFNNFGSGSSNNFGLTSGISSTFGLASGFSSDFGLTSGFSDDFGLTSEFSSDFGLTSNRPTDRYQSNIDLFPMDFDTSSSFQSSFGVAPTEQTLGSNFQTSGFPTFKTDSESNPSTLFMGTPEDTFSAANLNSNYDMDTSLNLDPVPLEAFSSTHTFGSGSTNWNSNNYEDALNLRKIPVDDSSSFSSEKTDEVRNDFKDSLFLNIISSDDILNFLQKVSKENADKFAIKLESILAKTFGFKSNNFTPNVYQKLIMSNNYPLDEYEIADLLASSISKSLSDQRILSKRQLIKTVEDTKQAIYEAISQITSSKSDDIIQEISTGNKLTGFKSSNDAETDANMKLDNQTKLSADTAKKIEMMKAKLTTAGIQKIINQKQLTEQNISKIMKSYTEKLAKELKLELNTEMMAEINKQLKDKLSSDETDLPSVFATVTANILEKNTSSSATDTEDTIQTATSILLQCLSEHFNTEVKSQKEEKDLNFSTEDNKNSEQIDVDNENKNNSTENLISKFIAQLKNKILQSGILKVVLTNKHEIDFKKVIENYCKHLAEKLDVKSDSGSFDSTNKRLFDAAFSNKEENIANVLTNFTGNILKSQQKLDSSTLDDIVGKAYDCFVLSLSDLKLNADFKTFQKTSNQEFINSKPEEGSKISQDKQNLTTSKEKQIISETEIIENAKAENVRTNNNDSDEDINFNTQNKAINKLGKADDKTSVEYSNDRSTKNEAQSNNKTEDKSDFANQGKQLDEEINKNNRNSNQGNDSKEISDSQNELKQNFGNALKNRILGTGIFEALSDKNLREEDTERLSKLYSKLLAEKFQILVDINKIKLFSNGLRTIKTDSDYQNAVQILTNVTADILIEQDKLNSKNLHNAVDLAMKCAIETFSDVIGQELSIDQGTDLDASTDIIENKDMNTETSLITGDLNSDLNINTNKEIKSSSDINNKTLKTAKNLNSDDAAADSSNIDSLLSGQSPTDLEKKQKETNPNLQQTQKTDEINVKNTSDLETKLIKNANEASGDRTEVSLDNDSKSTFIDLLKAKISATGIDKDFEKIQLNPQEVEALIETYTKIVSDKLQINVKDDITMSFFMEFLNSKKLTNTFIDMTADILSDQGVLSKTNQGSLSDSVIQCLQETISPSFNLESDTKGVTKIETDLQKSVDKSVIGNTKINSENKELETTKSTAVLTESQKSKPNSIIAIKQNEDFNFDILTPVNENTKLDDKADLYGQTAEPGNDKKEQAELNSKLQSDKEKGASTIPNANIKEKFMSVLKAKIIETEILNDLLKKSLTNEDIIALSKLYTQQLSAELQIKLNDSVVERFIEGFLTADKTAEQFISILVDITADIMTDQNLLTASSQNMLADKSAQCVLLSMSQLLDTEIKGKANLNTEPESTSSLKSNNPAITTNTNTDLGSSGLMNSNTDLNMPKQIPIDEFAKDFVFDQKFVDQLDTQANMKDKNTKSVPPSLEASSITTEKGNDSVHESTNKKDDKSEESKTSNKTKLKEEDNKQKDEPSGNEDTSQGNLNSGSSQEIKEKLAIDLATALASSEEFKLSVLTANLEDIVQAIASAIEAVCGTEASLAFQTTFSASIKN